MLEISSDISLIFLLSVDPDSISSLDSRLKVVSVNYH